MARKRKQTFWTFDRLKELDRLFKTYTLRQISLKLGKREEDIQSAYEFWQAHKRLKISSVQKRKIRVTIYRASYAEGGHRVQSYRDELTLL